MRELKTMTVGELKEELENYHDDTLVVFEVPSGDHWGRMLAGSIGQLADDVVEWSEYHRQFRISGDEPSEDAAEVIVLS